MIRSKIANMAKGAEKLISSFKINRKICVVLAVLIAFGGATVSLSGHSSFSAVAESSSQTQNAAGLAISPTSAPTESSLINMTYDKNSYCLVTISKHGSSKQYIVKKGNVKKALATAKVTVGSKDKMNCKLSDTVKDGMKIVINKVVYKTKSSTKTISYKKFLKTYPDESTKKLTKNAKVKVSKTVRVKYVNDKKVSVEMKSLSYKSVKKKSKKALTNAAVKVSANAKNYISYSSLNAISELKPTKDFKLTKAGVPVSYKQKITGTASAYSCGTHTATGKRVKPGYIAVNPKQIPYGTKLFVRSSDGNYVYGYASAEDTGGFVSWGNTVADLFFWSESDCVNFGRRSIEIYVLD